MEATFHEYAEIICLGLGFGAAVVLWLLWRCGCWLHERLALTPEERWRRRYDEKLKKHFKSL